MGYFKNINLINFRNFDNLKFEFSKKCNVLYGKNGSGKTNILEAISLFSKGRGIRNDQLSNLIKKNYDKFIIKSDFENKQIKYKLITESREVNFRQRKIIKINNDDSKEFLNNFYKLVPFLTFVPETERLFTSSPSNRRNFIDRLIFTHQIEYNKLINKYNKSLLERSKIIKNKSYDNNWLDKIEKNISNFGIQIYLLRQNQIDSLIRYLNLYIKDFNLSFLIRAQLNDKFYFNKLDENFFAQELKNNRDIDALYGSSKIGPHKSDYIFYIDKDYPVSQLSTGQQKTIILLIFLSQCQYLLEHFEQKPILLLDEICSHLDQLNREIMLNLIEKFNLQVFMTGTSKKLFSFLSTKTNFCNITI